MDFIESAALMLFPLSYDVKKSNYFFLCVSYPNDNF